MNGERRSTGIGIWRFAERLPGVGGRLVTLGEGSTPLVPLERLGRELGIPRLYAKIEGANPTGSYKDRIAALSLSLALAQGRRGWVATSSGNAGASLAAYGARAGLPGLLLVTPSIPREKLVPCRVLGATVVRVADIGMGGSAAAATHVFETARALAGSRGLFLGITANTLNPDGMRGADTIGYELAQAQLRAGVCYVPTGGGGLSVSIARGLAACGAGLRVVCAQPEGCAPIAGVLEGRFAEPTIASCESAISGLQLPAPPDGDLAVAHVRNSGGWGSAIGDAAIYSAQAELARLEGIFAEPAAATGIAAAAEDRRRGRLAGDEDVVAVLTGAGLKDLATAERGLKPVPDATPDEVGGLIESWAAGLAGATDRFRR